jgi:ATP-dependent DNA helicase RecG
MGLQHRSAPASKSTSSAPAAETPTLRKASKIAKRPAAKKPRAPRDPLAILKLADPRHALMCAPARYVDCREAHDMVSHSLVDEPAQLYRLRYTGAARGLIKKTPIWHVPSDEARTLADLPQYQVRRAKRTVLEMQDARGTTVYLSLFTGPYRWLDLQVGEEVVVVGSLSSYPSGFYLTFDDRPPPQAINGIWTSYRGIAGQLAGERIQLLVAAAMLDESSARSCAALIMGETGLREDALLLASANANGDRFPSIAALLGALHKPASVPQGEEALECAKRISALAVQAAALRHHSRAAHPSAPLAIDLKDIDRIKACLPYPLTQGQLSVVQAICSRLQEPVPLSALLSGDVGTGKTQAFLVPAVAAHLAGARVAIIAPRQLLADQIAREVLERFSSLVKETERIEAGDTIQNPQAILVGTSGMVTAARKRGYVPQLLIVDEQHKLSTSDREALVGPGTHLLEVSATPVPRSLAASLYDGLEILNLRECPVEKKIRSHVMDMKDRGQVISALRHALARGERAAMVYPRVSSEKDEHNSVTAAYASLDKAFPGQCVMLHGQMEDDEVRRNIELFRSGERRLVVASTVLEIGLDIPSMSVMVVRDADCFGISQLHQLRGRLVRNGGSGDFLMVVGDLQDLPEESSKRLAAVASTNDGYELAEIDLLQRGFGEVDGDAQTGMSKTLFRLVQLRVEDFMARKLRSMGALAQQQPARRVLAQESSQSGRHVQERLL